MTYIIATSVRWKVMKPQPENILLSEPLKESSGIVAIFREFLGRYPRQFGLLFLLLVVQGAAASLSVLAIVPMADFLLDPTLKASSRITQFLIRIFSEIGMSPS